jgi:hypothetical protein
MKRAGVIGVVLTLGLCLFLPAGLAEAGKHRRKKPSGVDGVVRNATCYGPCAVPAQPDPIYAGIVTVNVSRASDGVQVRGTTVSDGHFRFRLKRGSYDVSVVPPAQPSCQPSPTVVCPADASPQSTAVIAPCETGETQRVKVRKSRFTHVELHVQNVCIV